MARSALDITYKDLVDLAKGELAWMQKQYPRLVTEKRISGDSAAHKIEAKKILIRMLEKHKKDPQLNLNDLFDEKKHA